MKNVLTRSAAMLVPLLLSLAAGAAPVTYHYTGVVDDDEAGRGYLQFAGSFAFDSSASDSIADPSTAAYGHAGAPWGLSIAFDGGAPLLIDASFNVLVSNDLLGSDQWGLLAQDPLQSISITLTDFGGLVFGSDSLPLPGGGLTLASFDSSWLRWETDAGALQGHLTSLACSAGCSSGGGDPPPIQPVPEPGTLLLVGVGLMSLRVAHVYRVRA